MPLDLAALREIPVERTIETVLWRTVHLPFGERPDPMRVVASGGRWPTGWTLYTGSTEAVAWSEYCRNHAVDIDAADPTGGVGLNEVTLESFAALEVDDPLLRRGLFELDFAFDRLADLTTPWAEQLLERSGFDLSDFYADKYVGYGCCPDLAALVGDLGWEAMRVPSAAWQRSDGWCIPVFEAGRLRLLGHRERVPAARPTVALAVATSYAVGERPRWLGQ
jgi:hypothetical protein